MGLRKRSHWPRQAAAAALSANLLAACSPTLDWRENAAEGTGLVTSFPCRPDRHERAVHLLNRTVPMQMLVCSAGGATYAVGFFDAEGPAQVGSGLAALRVAMLANVQASEPRLTTLKVGGMTPNPESTRLVADGRRPDGGPLRLEAAFFSKGARVYQAAIVGSALKEAAVDPFFEGLRLAQ